MAAWLLAWEHPERTHCFAHLCPSWRGQPNALESLSPQNCLDAPDQLKNTLRSAQQKQADPSPPLLVCQVNFYSCGKAPLRRQPLSPVLLPDENIP